MMSDAAALLVLNAGSSSLKFSLFHLEAPGVLHSVVRGQVDGLGARPRWAATDGSGRSLAQPAPGLGEVQDAGDAARLAAAWLHDHYRLERVSAVGHRVVHGGAVFSQPVRVNEAVLIELERLVPLAPLHQPHNLAAIRALRAWQPDLPQVACFDTAFHRTHPPLADLYALPRRFYDAGVRRYGFHGLSFEYLASVLPQVAPELARGRVVALHLGNGASLCALRAGRSVDATMGFSTLDGIPMGTRPGAIDPGVLIYLLRQHQLSHDELETLLYRQSGLLGLSGVSHDMRLLLDSTQPEAVQAVDFFVWRVAKEIGALAASLGGLDGLVFTAGIGENSAVLRARIVRACTWLGLELDPEANAAGGPCLTTPGSRASAWVIPTNEELMIARHTLACLSQDDPRAVSTAGSTPGVPAPR